MFKLLAKKLFGTRNQRMLRKFQKIVDNINSFEPLLQKLSDDELKEKTNIFRQRISAGDSLDSILPEAFAVVREASVRVLGMRHFDVQLVGGMALHYGKISEMRTGEGKTLTSTLPVYLNALTGKGVHLITVNDYLVERDAEWMRPVHEFLGLTLGVNLTTSDFEAKKAAYAADITYGTNNEFGFDYLRDNMAFDLDGRVQRPLHYAIIDEVDSVLIDEARTPLIISGPSDERSELYTKIDVLIPKLTRQAKKEHEDDPEPEGDYTVDEKDKQVMLSEDGHEHIEKLMQEAGLLDEDESLYDPKNSSLLHHINAALRAHTLFKRDVEYIVRDDEIIIVDEHTGRLMAGRRWSEGLHQAVEAKERVTIQNENQTLASITFQNFFRLYEKLSGMTGTADTEAYEFQSIYGLEVVVIDTNKPMVRKDNPDLIFLNTQFKFNAILEDIKGCQKTGQPVLVGTASIDTSEYISAGLKKAGIQHELLNAKFHAKEAGIIAQAGKPGAVTIATNMAGRGTDIVLGGNWEAEAAELKNPDPAKIEAIKARWRENHAKVIEAGGLYVLCTERNESRRIDNQLRGRSGRQGDPGASRFYLSLDDSLIRIFASERLVALMKRLGMNDEPLENRMITNSIESAQRKVEGHNFDIRKQLLEYDDVANDQRKIIYAKRLHLLESETISKELQTTRENVIARTIANFIPHESLEEQWDVPGLEKAIEEGFGTALPIAKWLETDDQLHEEGLREKIKAALDTAYQEKMSQIEADALPQLEKNVMLQSLDTRWKEHLLAMDHLRQGIHLRSYAQKNPIQEFKRESFYMFKDLLDGIDQDTVHILSTLQIQAEPSYGTDMDYQMQMSQFNYQHADAQSALGGEEVATLAEQENETAAPETYVREAPKVGRNDPCPCDSGKKYKQCHGKLQ